MTREKHKKTRIAEERERERKTEQCRGESAEAQNFIEGRRRTKY